MELYISILSKNDIFYDFLVLMHHNKLVEFINFDIHHINDEKCIAIICDYETFDNVEIVNINKPIIFLSNLPNNLEKYLLLLNILNHFSSQRKEVESGIYKLGKDTFFSIEKHSVITKNNKQLLTSLEFRFLYYLLKHEGPCSVDTLLNALDLMSPSSLYVCVKKLREKIEIDSNSPSVIVHVKNKGYYLDI